MGSGSSKTHESFTVTPSLDPPDTDTVPATQLAPFTADWYDDLKDQVAEGLIALGADPDAVNDELGTNIATDAPPTGLDDVDPTAEPDPAPDPEPGPQVHDPAAAPSSEEALTPIPDALPVGDPCGVPVAVGGADLADSTATLLAYDSPQGPREVLVAVVDEAAEAKLIEALAVSDAKVPIEVETDVHGRLPLDQQLQLHEQVEKIAKSINHHLATDGTIPQHTLDNHAQLQNAIFEAAKHTQAGTPDAAMIDHYTAAANTLGERLLPSFNTPYGEGGKIAYQAPFEVTTTATVTKMVPAPIDDTASGLVAESRPASRPAPHIDASGTAHWDGQARSSALKGTEYAIDLGDGYHAVYRPHTADNPAEYSLRGALEITAPAGAGHSAELVDRLGQLNLVNRPMTPAEGEWTYLQRNVWAQRLDGHHAVTQAAAESAGLEDAMEQVLFAQRAHQAVGMNDPELSRLARQLRLDAEAQVLPHKVRLLRDGVAAATGHTSGSALAGSPGYDPTPRRRGGWLTWGRFDVDPNAVRAAFGDRVLTHNVSGHDLVDVLRTGVLASTERRQLMGISGGKGASESADKASGGASSVFLRVASPSNSPTLVWDDPTVVLARADWYAYNGDHFGSLNPASGHSVAGQTRDPYKVAGFTSATNEVMFRTGLDLLGAEAPSRIRCTSSAERNEVLALLASKGITHLRGTPINKVVTTH